MLGHLTGTKSLKKLMVYFANVREIDLHTVNWNMRYDRNNRTYRMLMAVCCSSSKDCFKPRATAAHDGFLRRAAHEPPV